MSIHSIDMWPLTQSYTLLLDRPTSISLTFYSIKNILDSINIVRLGLLSTTQISRSAEIVFASSLIYTQNARVYISKKNSDVNRPNQANVAYTGTATF